MKNECKILMIAAVAVLSLFALVNVQEGADAEGSFVEKEIPTNEFFTETGTMTVRYYSDQPNVPYADFSAVYEKLQKATMTVTDEGGGIYSIKNNKEYSEGTAIFDSNENTLSFEDLRAFLYITDVNSSGEDTQPVPFLQELSGKYLTNPKEIVYDLGSYDIKGYMDGGSLWLPFATCGDIFMSNVNYYALCMGDIAFFIDIDCVEPLMSDEDYIGRYISWLFSTTRSEDAAIFDYNELCFVMDNMYGDSGRTVLGKDLASKGLDKALEEYSDTTRTIRNYLKSQDVATYIAGISSLGRFFQDGGHTMLSLHELLLDALKDYPYEDIRTMAAELEKEVKAQKAVIEEGLPAIESKEEYLEELYALRAEKFGKDTYIEYGSTAVFIFDFFELDDEAWIDYYENGGPIPDDTFGTAYKAMKKADENPEIKNFIFDITTNGGGILATMMGMLGVMTGEDYTSFMEDKETGEVYKGIIDIDVNLDKKFDRKDNVKPFDLNFGILESAYSFSCANLFSIMAKLSGIAILGETSGGGGHSVMNAASSEGLFRIYSSYTAFTINYGSEDYDEFAIEKGAVPDYVLVKTDAQGQKDISMLYDLATLDRYMNEFYAEPDSDDTLMYVGIAIAAIAVILVVVFFGAKSKKP